MSELFLHKLVDKRDVNLPGLSKQSTLVLKRKEKEKKNSEFTSLQMPSPSFGNDNFLPCRKDVNMAHAFWNFLQEESPSQRCFCELLGPQEWLEFWECMKTQHVMEEKEKDMSLLFPRVYRGPIVHTSLDDFYHEWTMWNAFLDFNSASFYLRNYMIFLWD